MTGMISSELGSMTALDTIIGYQKSLLGPIPESISHLMSVKNLDLSYNTLDVYPSPNPYYLSKINSHKMEVVGSRYYKVTANCMGDFSVIFVGNVVT